MAKLIASLAACYQETVFVAIARVCLIGLVQKPRIAELPETATGAMKLAAIPREYERRFETEGELKAFIDERELLRRVPVSRRTLFDWRYAGKLPFVNLGGRRNLYHWPSVEAALLRMQRGGGQ